MNALFTKLTRSISGTVKIILQLSCFALAGSSSFAQNVGIGIVSPVERLEVAGNIKAASILSTNAVGIGTTVPLYKLHIVDGSIGIDNSTSGVTWSFNNYTSNGLGFLSNGIARLIISNTGNVGIGNGFPAYKLDVDGSLHTDGNAVIDGNLTVNNGKGIIQNSQGASQLKYYTRTVTAGTGNMPGFGMGIEFSIGFAGVFTNPPKVFVGDIVSTGGTVGDLLRVIMVIYDVTTTGCHARLINTSPNPVNYTTTWNIICVGD